MSRRARERSGVWAAKRHQMFTLGPEPEERQDDTEGGAPDVKHCGCYPGRCRGGTLPAGVTCKRAHIPKRGGSTQT